MPEPNATAEATVPFPAATPNPILTIARTVSQADLDDLDRRVEGAERELAELRRVREFAVRLLQSPDSPQQPQPRRSLKGLPARKPSPVAASTPSVEKVARAMLSAHDEAVSVNWLGNVAGLSKATIYGSLKHPWFERVADGWRLTKEGERAAKDLPEE